MRGEIKTVSVHTCGQRCGRRWVTVDFARCFVDGGSKYG